MVRDDQAGSGGLVAPTPLPGVRVAIDVYDGLTPIAQHEVLTDKDGRMAEEVIVKSSANLYVYSLNQAAVSFFKMGSATDFHFRPSVIGTPGVDLAGACLSIVDGTPVAEVKYNLVDITQEDLPVGVTSLFSDLYNDPNTLEDDLAINSIVDNSLNYVLPFAEYLGTGSQTGQQIFHRSGTFVVPWDQAKAPYTGQLLGRDLYIDIDSPICEGGGILLCDEIPQSSFEALHDEVRTIMSKYLSLMERLTRSKEPTRRYKRAARRYYAQSLRLLAYTPVPYQCPPDQSLAPDCELTSIQRKDVLAAIDKLFEVTPPGNRGSRTIERVRKRSRRKISQALDELIPDDYWLCPE